MARKAAPVQNADESAMTSLARSVLGRMLGVTHAGKRDLYQVFGYNKTLLPEDFYGMYSRNDIAHRIISAYPKATWRDMPVIRDEQGDSAEKGDGYSAFTDSVDKFFEAMRIMRTMERADRLSTICQYGVLFLGFGDGKQPNEPVEGKAKLLFLSPYHQINAKVSKWNTDIKSPRYGMPELYLLTNTKLDATQDSSPSRSITAHWSRVIHIAEGLDQDEVHGMPRLQPVFNRLTDLEKVVGGAAETFWLTADRGIALWADKDTVLDDDAKKALKDQAEEFSHRLRRYFVGQGMNAQVLGSESPDPKPNAEILIDLISGAVGIPKRILLGTERGELASSQDENNWSERITERRKNHATPNILMPFINRMIETGNIAEPVGRWWIEWPEKGSLGPMAEADIAIKRATALATYANSPDAQMVVPVQEFRRDFLGMEPESEYEVELPEEIDEELPTVTEEPDDEPAEEAEGEEEFVDASNAAIANMAPKPLYVSRNVRNAEAIRKWAKEQGLDGFESVDQLHVTVCHSRAPMDWLAVAQSFGEDEDGSFLVHPGGPRVVEQFNDTIVLSFVSDGLSWRHRELKQAGASHDYAKYQPHISICKLAKCQEVDLSKIKPFTGAIALGPEIFEEIEE